MSKHTPGPWKVRKTFYGETYIEGKDGDFVCAFPEPNKKDVAIIAAAPEMKGLLYKAHEKLADLNNNYELGDDNPVDLCFEIRNILHRIDGEGGSNG